MSTKNSLYNLTGTLDFYFMSFSKRNIGGDLSFDILGFFKDGHLLYDNDKECPVLGHIKNKNFITHLSFLMSIEDKLTLDRIFRLSNPNSRYDPSIKNFGGHYIGNVYINLGNSIAIPYPKLLGDYDKFEEMITTAIANNNYIKGYTELDMKKIIPIAKNSISQSGR